MTTNFYTSQFTYLAKIQHALYIVTVTHTLLYTRQLSSAVTMYELIFGGGREGGGVEGWKRGGVIQARSVIGGNSFSVFSGRAQSLLYLEFGS